MTKLTTQDGATLHYRLSGRDTGRPPLVLVHGWCSNLEHWKFQTRHFSKRHKVLCIDRRGQGKSTTPGTGHTAQQHAQDIAQVIKACGLKGVIVVGHAGGGPGTLEFLGQFPRLARAGVLIDSGMYPKPRLNNPESRFGMVLGTMLKELQNPRGEAAFKRMYQGYFDKRCDPGIARAAVADACRTPMPVKIAELKGMNVSTQKLAQQISRPVLWLTANLVDQQYIAKHLQQVQFAQTVGAGHFPHLEVPGQVNAMLETFCAQLK